MNTTIGNVPLRYGEWYWYVTPEFKVIRVFIQETKYGGLVDSDVEMIYLIDEVGLCTLTTNEPMSLFPDTEEGHMRAVCTAVVRIDEYIACEEIKLKPLKDRREELAKIMNRK